MRAEKTHAKRDRCGSHAAGLERVMQCSRRLLINIARRMQIQSQTPRCTRDTRINAPCDHNGSSHTSPQWKAGPRGFRCHFLQNQHVLRSITLLLPAQFTCDNIAKPYIQALTEISREHWPMRDNMWNLAKSHLMRLAPCRP